MKNLEEKKLLLQMMRAFGQEDKELAESIRREEELSKILFKEEVKPVKPEPKVQKVIVEEPVVLVEAEPAPPPVPAFTPPVTDTVTSVMNVLKTTNTANNFYRDKEIEGIRRTLAEVMQKIGTMSWGGGGTGAVRIIDQDDLDKSSVANGRYMKYQDGWFVMDEINPFEIIHNTTLVTTNTYTVLDSDYYIGVNYAGPVTITIPASISSGREVVIKDESGNCETHNIKVSAKVDNDANGFILAVNNGAIHMLYRGDSWRII